MSNTGDRLSSGWSWRFSVPDGHRVTGLQGTAWSQDDNKVTVTVPDALAQAQPRPSSWRAPSTPDKTAFPATSASTASNALARSAGPGRPPLRLQPSVTPPPLARRCAPTVSSRRDRRLPNRSGPQPPIGPRVLCRWRAGLAAVEPDTNADGPAEHRTDRDDPASTQPTDEPSREPGTPTADPEVGSPSPHSPRAMMEAANSTVPSGAVR